MTTSRASVAGDYLAANFKDAKIAVVHDKTPYGQGLADETKKAMNANGVTEVMYEGVNVGDKDFSALIAKMKEAGVSVVYWGGLHTEAGLIIRQLADQGLKATFMSGDGIVSNELASIAGDAVDGTLMTFAPDPRKNPDAKELVEKFRAAGFEPEAYTLYSYAAMQVIAAAAKAAGANDPQKVAEAAQGQWSRSRRPSASIGFDEKGDTTRPDYVMYTGRRVTTASTPTSKTKCNPARFFCPKCPALCAGHFFCADGRLDPKDRTGFGLHCSIFPLHMGS